MLQKPLSNPPADDAPYSLKIFVWLMEHSAAPRYFTEAELLKINLAVKNKDDAVLQPIFPFIMGEFVKERDIAINFALREEALTQQFLGEVREEKSDVRDRRESREKKTEATEKKQADKILEAHFA